jgi:deoxycytidine triphosphate deaminase
MTVKSDRWIRRMAAERKMIEPFEANQVRQIDGGRVISYGTSSYGYDVRCAPEFKVFTNINSAVVDPKKFDESSFVDMQGSTCVIPPNSFALARTVEYFRIPRNVLTICLGKCVTGDTRVVDAETGAFVPIGEFNARHKTVGMEHWTLAGQSVTAVMPRGRKPVFELTTRAGLKIRATENHPFRQFAGWTPLNQLRPGDRIAVARRIPVFGEAPLPDWEAILLGLMISEGQCCTPGYSPVFTSTDPVLVGHLRQAVLAGGLGEVTHNGVVGYRLVNHQNRGGVPHKNRAAQWLERHGINVRAGDKLVPQAVFTAPRQSTRLFLQALFSGDGGLYSNGESFFLEYYSKSRRLIEDVHHLLLRFGIFSLIREKRTKIGTKACSIQITDREQILRFSDEIGFLAGSIKQLRLEREILPLLRAQPIRLRSNFDTLPREAWTLLTAVAASHGRSFNSMGLYKAANQSVPYKCVAQIALMTASYEIAELLDGPVWDVVKEISPAGEEEVFDLSVPAVENFVANDIIVHNSTYARCGIIVNVTPLEPEWEGHVTLEFSNTTTLPAKIYANEGVAQMIFFESDEVCETSYADRGGKYQGQRGVTLPRT